MAEHEDTQTDENTRATDAWIGSKLTRPDSRKVLGRLADVYEATSDERKDTLGLMLRRNFTARR